jgi:hypothetical protein
MTTRGVMEKEVLGKEVLGKDTIKLAAATMVSIHVEKRLLVDDVT